MQVWTINPQVWVCECLLGAHNIALIANLPEAEPPLSIFLNDKIMK